MADQGPGSASRRARPLAELAFEPLLERVRELSRRWAVALIVDMPYDSLGELPLEHLAADGPELISAVIGALGSDEELDRLREGGRSGGSPAARIPALAGTADPAAVIDAVEALRGVLWDTLFDEFGSSAPGAPRARVVAELSDRLAHVCAAMLARALSAVQEEAPRPAIEPAPVQAGVPAVRLAAPRGPRRSAAVLVDERAFVDEAPPFEAPTPAAPAPPVAEPTLVDEIQIRDERGDEGPAAWIRSIGRRLELFERDGVPFAVLLVELRRDGARQAVEDWDPIEEQLAEELRTGGEATMTRERAGRYWLLAPGAERLAAAGLATRLTRTLDSLVAARGLGLSVAIGTAVCPEDGARAAALAAHADVGLFAARAERHATAPADGPPGR